MHTYICTYCLIYPATQNQLPVHATSNSQNWYYCDHLSNKSVISNTEKLFWDAMPLKDATVKAIQLFLRDNVGEQFLQELTSETAAIAASDVTT